MHYTRVFKFALSLLLVLAGSGLSVLCAPCAAAPAPPACHAAASAQDPQAGAWQAECCCLLDAGAAQPAPYVPVVEYPAAAIAQVARGPVAEWRVRPAAPAAARGPAALARAPFFRLYCSFLI